MQREREMLHKPDHIGVVLEPLLVCNIGCSLDHLVHQLVLLH